MCDEEFFELGLFAGLGEAEAMEKEMQDRLTDLELEYDAAIIEYYEENGEGS